MDIALYELTLKAGVPMDSELFRRILGLISLGCDPDIILRMLRCLVSMQSENASITSSRNRTIRADQSSSSSSRYQSIRSGFGDKEMSGYGNPGCHRSNSTSSSDYDQTLNSTVLSKPSSRQIR